MPKSLMQMIFIKTKQAENGKKMNVLDFTLPSARVKAKVFNLWHCKPHQGTFLAKSKQ